MRIAVIGAGLGGISASCLLASKGHEVHVFEKNDGPGGKINQVKAGGFRFDTGPSLLTMPGVLKRLFKRCDASLDDYLSIQPVDPICRYFYPDGTRFDCHQSSDQMLNEINRIAPEDARAYQQFLNYSRQLYEHTGDAFLFNALYDLSDIRSLTLTDIFKIDALQTVGQRVDSSFESSYLRQLFKRFTTYNGSSPFQAPATLNVIPHIELGMGGWYIHGGMYQLIEALMKLAQEQGVEFHFSTEIQSIDLKNDSACGVHTSKTYFPAELVISNSDARETYLSLLGSNEVSFLKKKRIKRNEPSSSGLVLLLGVEKSYEQLSHHNIFFSKDYKQEFHAIFNRKVMPEDPTIYVADTSQSNRDHAPTGGSNLFVLVNAPYLSDEWSWEKESDKYIDFIIDELENRGLKDLRETTVYRHRITPVDFYEQYRSDRGSIYGTSSNSKLSAFIRPGNKARGIDGLYLVGGSTHPGGGIPLVILSAFHAVELIKRYEH